MLPTVPRAGLPVHRTTDHTFRARSPTWVGTVDSASGRTLDRLWRRTVQDVQDPRVPFTRRLTFAHLVTVDVVAALLLAGVLAASAQVPRPSPLQHRVAGGAWGVLGCAPSAGIRPR